MAHYHVHKNSKLDPTLNHMDPVYTLTSYFLNNHINIVLPSIPESAK